METTIFTIDGKDYCDYDTCVALKELGYPIKIYKIKGEEKEFPILLYEAQKWLRKKKGIYVMIETPWKTDDGLGWSYICCNKPLTEEDQDVCFASGGFYDSFEEALLMGINSSIYYLKSELK